MKILVVVDMQNDFIYRTLGNAECAAVGEPAPVLHLNPTKPLWMPWDWFRSISESEKK